MVQPVSLPMCAGSLIPLVVTIPDLSLQRGCFQLWAAPAGKLVDLYKRLHNVSNPAEVVQIAREYDVFFAPPVSAAIG
jgi:hypothetical protein